MAEDSLLSHFDGKNILLVGFDCFVGKVVLVKLLTAVNPEKIFLIASKRNSEKALHELLNSEICDPIRMDMGPDFSEMVSERLCEIPANLQKDGLGLSTDDAATLREKLDVVIECSSADMDILPLKDAVRKNVDDPLRLLTFTKECTKTPPFVHVSTAFANANHQGMVTVTETLHELPFDFHDVLQEIREASDSDIKSVQNRLMRGWPNAFTFTKALGEHALAVNRDSTDLFILRPSFVSPALSGPVAGYTETASIPAAFVFAGAAGVARSFYAEPSYKVDLIPVDFCADAVIACGGEALAEPEPSSSSSSSAPASAPVSPGREREERRNTRGRRREGDLGRLEVVAVSTSALNPARWEMLARTVNLYFHENPVPEDQLMGPRAASNGLTVELRTSIHKHRLAVAREKQQRLFSASNSSHARAAKKVLEQQLEPFMNSEWVFQGEKLALLAERLSDEDRQHLKLDVRSIVWDGYLKILCYGVERFLLHNLKAQPPAVTMTSEPMPCGVSRVSWDIDHFSVPKKGGSLKLLQGVKGSLEPGQVTAVMGPSGAGKSTFLMLLAGRGQTGELQGEIAVNGRSAAPEQLKSSCAFVEQEDSLLGYLTVDEELGFAARLRQESSDRAGKIGALRRSHAIDRVKRELGLEDIGDRPIGDYFRKGISGGQKRRVSIGKELVASRSILFLDEPTSGLDSFSCLQVIRAISELAKRRMLTVFVTIHQPSQEVLQVFDRIIFLTRGKLAYDGPVNYVLPFFDQLGYPAPPNTNAADHVIQVINTDFHEAKEEIDELVRKSAELSEKARTEGWANVFGSTAPAVKVS
uniref:ABC transporter domain-containing protein n=1 Tax=Chromera velia CCMP2878 TaxID=1169474 RepID=A0A0G4FNJ0_9ALVE|eukprot:Cvel_3553.t1-p1 / transcript=Cvel_3553.t1 / gene=Cvel_3553 / organism=Chromera_velia_CCMP2878 / gene_product=ABC transporter G family member 12, putative / transcript_product=ABC transporter G family member 12, putative / location=Cvel_scaffold145:23779-29044(-) / protein_length=815 / sequence_SO=supercontig / SO=protein_coding / is_pseudo=false